MHVSLIRRGGARNCVEQYLHGLPLLGWQVFSSYDINFDDDSFGSLRWAWSSVRMIRGLRPDILHAHGFAAGVLARVFGRGCFLILEPHGWAARRAPRGLRHAVRLIERLTWRADLFVLLSRDAALQRKVRVAVVRSWPHLTRDAAHLPLDRPFALVVGRAAQQKGTDRLLRIWANSEHAGWHLGFAGASDQELSRFGALPDGVIGLGWRDDIRSLLESAAFLLHGARWEGDSLALREACSVGIPVLTFEVENLEPRSNWRVIAQGDEHLFLQHLNDWLQHEPDRAPPETENGILEKIRFVYSLASNADFGEA